MAADCKLLAFFVFLSSNLLAFLLCGLHDWRTASVLVIGEQ